MKKIYLEKQFIKATDSHNYIVGEIVAHSKENGLYQIKKEDGSIFNVFSHSILGWEDDDRPNRAFGIDKLKRIYRLRLSGNNSIKTIYTIDSCRCENGKNIFGVLRTEVFKDGYMAISDIRVVRCDFKEVTDILYQLIDNHKYFDVKPEVRVCTVGLGKGLLDYLDKCPIPIKEYGIIVKSDSITSLNEKVKSEKLALREKGILFDTLVNLNIELLDSGKMKLAQNERNDEQKTLTNCLLMACYELEEMEVSWHQFELYIEKGHTEYLTPNGNISCVRYYLILKDIETGEEDTITSTHNCYEIENVMSCMATTLTKAGKRVKVHIGIKEKESTK